MHRLTVEEIESLIAASSFDELAEIALSSLARMRSEHTEIVQICGPMSTGGCGDFQKNMKRFNECIEVAIHHGVAVFNQILFQDAAIRICSWKDGDPYPMELLEVFYGKVLSSGYITKGLFLPDWESSLGARWERKFLSDRGLIVEEYPLAWLERVN